MRWMLSVLLSLVLASSFVPATPVPKDVALPIYYFPTKIGTKWVYQEGAQVTTEVVTKVEQNKSAFVVHVGTVEKDGKIDVKMQMVVSETGLCSALPDGVKHAIPRHWLKLPLKVGEEWSFDVDRIRWFGPVRLMAFGPEEVTVPAGTFQAIRIEMVWRPVTRAGEKPGRNNDFGEIQATSWYAPGVGKVKETRPGQDPADNMVLTSFTPGKE